MLEAARASDRRILDPEVHRVPCVRAELGDERVVGTQDQPAAMSGDDFGPAIADRLELAIAIQLVAEEVRDQDHPRIERGRDARKPELVDFEDADLCAFAPATRQQRGRDAAGHVGAGEVVDARNPGAREDRAGQRRGRGLAVGRGDRHATAGQLAREPADRGRLESQQQPPGYGRPAASCESRQRADCAGRGHLQ